MTGKRKILLLLGDILVLIGSFFATLYIGYLGRVDEQIVTSHTLPFIIIYTTWLVILYLFNLYEYNSIRPTVGNIRNIATSLIVCMGVGLSFFYVFPIFGISPKTNLFINVVIFGTLFIGWRRLFFKIFSKFFRRRVVILGRNVKSEELAEEIKKNPHIGYEFIGFADSLEDDMVSKANAIIVGRNFNFDTRKINTLMSESTEIMDIVEAYEKIFSKIPIEFIDESWFVQNIKNTDRGLYYLAKRIFDIIVSLLVAIIFLPFFILVSIGIKIEDGRNIFYKQKRVGLYNKTFYLYKFQSYIQGAEKNGPEWSQNGDPRITRFGRFLRKTHIDEIPQVINVLRGELSLVGPRPERPEFVENLEKEVPYFDLRHVIKPGVTGWAQVKFRYAGSILESYQKFEFDMYYAKNQNFYMDLGIIFRTVQKFFI